MEDQANDFIVNSKGHCFFCQDKIKIRQLQQRLESKYSLQGLSKYLKMDLTKVFSQKGLIPPHLLAKVERSRLRVELCGDCADLSNSFSVLYQQWKRLEMEMESRLNHIKGKLTRTSEELELDGAWKSEEDKGLIQIVDVLRMEAFEKCSDRIGSSGPRIKIQKLTKKKVEAYLRTTKKSTGSMTGSKSDAADVMDEDYGTPCFDDDAGENNEDNLAQSISEPHGYQKQSISIFDTPGKAEEKERKPTLVEEPKTTGVPSMSRATIEERNYTIDSKTRKYKCNLCSKEFQQRGFDYHYKSVHLKIRYKCNLCGKEFSNKPNYNKHLRSAHLGIRFKCPVCTQQFTSKQSLKLHQRSASCKGESGSK